MPDWISDLRLPELVQFSYDVANPAHVDLIADLIELVALKLLDHMNSVNVFKYVQCKQLSHINVIGDQCRVLIG